MARDQKKKEDVKKKAVARPKKVVGKKPPRKKKEKAPKKVASFRDFIVEPPLKNGRPRAFKSVKDLEKRVDDYMKECDQRMVDKITNIGTVVRVNDPERYTITGLALALGIDRRSLYRYRKEEGFEEFRPTLRKAISACEYVNEQRFYERGSATGAIFNAKCNFKYIEEKPEDEDKERDIKVYINTYEQKEEKAKEESK